MNNEVENPFKNIINDKKQKEEIGDTIIAFLENQKLIDIKKELKHLLIEFGYLLKDNNNEIVTLVKVKTPSKLLKKEKIFFLAMQQGELILLDNNKFNELVFRKVSDDMLKMHNVNMDSLNPKDYFMELY